MAKKRSDGSPRLLAWGPAKLTEAEASELNAICAQPKFLSAVSHLAGEYRAKIAHEEGVPSQGEVVASLEALIRQAKKVQDEVAKLADLDARLDELTRAALAPWLSRVSSLDEKLLAPLPANAALDEVIHAAERAIAAREEDSAVLKRGPRPRLAARRAGQAVRALFKAHGIKWSVTEARDNSRDSPAVRVFRIVTGNQGARIARYLPSA